MTKFEAHLTIAMTLIRVNHGDRDTITLSQLGQCVERASTVLDYQSDSERTAMEDRAMDDLTERLAYRINLQA